MANENQKHEDLCKKIELLSAHIEEIEKTGIKDLLKRVSHLESMLYCCKDMLNSKEACFYLGVSRGQLYKMTCANTIPFYKPRGKNIYFCKAELDEWMKRDPVKTIQDSVDAATLLLKLKNTERTSK